MKEIKALHIFAPGPIAGAEKVVITGLRSLIAINNSVHCLIIKESRNPILAENFKEELEKNSIPSSIVETDKAIDLRLRTSIKEFILDNKYTHIHTHGYKALLYSFMSTSSIHIHTHHGDTGHTKKVIVYEWLAKKVMKRVNQTVAVSSLMYKSLIQEGFKKRSITYIPNMLSIQSDEVTKIQKSKKIELIFIGRLSEEKGLQEFLPSLIAFKDHFNLKILGTGYLDQKLKLQVKNLDLSDNVQFLGFKKDITPELSKADILILPSHREGLPMTLLEAVCSGIPVIASKVGGIPDIINHKDNGYLFTPKATNEMICALEYCLENMGKLRNNAIEKSSVFKEQYSPEKWAIRTQKLYKSL